MQTYLEKNGFDSVTTQYIVQTLGVMKERSLRDVTRNDLKILTGLCDTDMKNLSDLIKRYKTSVAEGEIAGQMTNRLSILLGQLCETS